MGCAASVEDAPSHKYSSGDRTDSERMRLGMTGSDVTINSVRLRRFVSTLSSQFGAPPVHTYADQVELQQLAIEFGRDHKGQVSLDNYLPIMRDVWQEDDADDALSTGFHEMLLQMAQEDDMLSDGRLTPEPNTVSCSIARGVGTVRARLAARDHEIDYAELRFISKPCSKETRAKCVEWDGVLCAGVGLFDPSALFYGTGGYFVVSDCDTTNARARNMDSDTQRASFSPANPSSPDLDESKSRSSFPEVNMSDSHSLENLPHALPTFVPLS
jgi:hypothetical protein